MFQRCYAVVENITCNLSFVFILKECVFSCYCEDEMEKLHRAGISWTSCLPSPHTSVPGFSLTAVIASVLIGIIAKKNQ